MMRSRIGFALVGTMMMMMMTMMMTTTTMFSTLMLFFCTTVFFCFSTNRISGLVSSPYFIFTLIFKLPWKYNHRE